MEREEEPRRLNPRGGKEGATPWRTEGLPGRHGRVRRWWRVGRWVVLAVLIVLNVIAVNVLFAPEEHRVTVAYNVFVDQLQKGNVEQVHTRGYEIDGSFKRSVSVG